MDFGSIIYFSPLIPSTFVNALNKLFQAALLATPVGPTNITPCYNFKIYESYNTFSIKISLSKLKNLLSHSDLIASNNLASSIAGITIPGNTPYIKDLSNGPSSDINLGTTVSQNDLKINFYSSSNVCGFSIRPSDIALLLRFPAEFNTDLSDLKPKS